MNIYVPNLLIAILVYSVLLALLGAVLFTIFHTFRVLYVRVMHAKRIGWTLWCAWQIKVRHGSVKDWTAREVRQIVLNYLSDNPDQAWPIEDAICRANQATGRKPWYLKIDPQTGRLREKRNDGKDNNRL